APGRVPPGDRAASVLVELPSCHPGWLECLAAAARVLRALPGALAGISAPIAGQPALSRLHRLATTARSEGGRGLLAPATSWLHGSHAPAAQSQSGTGSAGGRAQLWTTRSAAYQRGQPEPPAGGARPAHHTEHAVAGQLGL